jgi:outer membrane protein TolC
MKIFPANTPLRVTALLSSLALAGCASVMPPTSVDAKVAAQWQAPLPHQGSVSNLAQWWQQQGDPVLVELITAAQSVSPSVSQALSLVAADATFIEGSWGRLARTQGAPRLAGKDTDWGAPMVAQCRS